MDYKLIAFDMDGTLLTSDKTVSDKTMEALYKVKEAGKEITISTGRNMCEMAGPLSGLPMVKYVMAISGALIMDVFNDAVIYSISLEKEIYNQIFDIVGDEDVMYHIHSDLSIMQKDKVTHTADYNMGAYQDMFMKITTKADNIREYCNQNNPNVYKLNLYCRSTEQREMLYERLKGLPIEMSYAETASLECSPKGISKGSGLKKLCEHLGITIDEAIAVGDAENDLEILKTAGLSVAMGNAKDIVKQTAAVTVSDNDHDGCAEVIYKYML